MNALGALTMSESSLHSWIWKRYGPRHSQRSVCSVVGILYALPESERALQGSIQDLCVTWWERGLPAKEDMGKTAFIMLLRRSLETKTVGSLPKALTALARKARVFTLGGPVCACERPGPMASSLGCPVLGAGQSTGRTGAAREVGAGFVPSS